MSPSNELLIENDVAINLGSNKHLLKYGNIYDENDIENADEKNFKIKVENGRTLGFSGDLEV